MVNAKKLECVTEMLRKMLVIVLKFRETCQYIHKMLINVNKNVGDNFLNFLIMSKKMLINIYKMFKKCVHELNMDFKNNSPTRCTRHVFS